MTVKLYKIEIYKDYYVTFASSKEEALDKIKRRFDYQNYHMFRNVEAEDMEEVEGDVYVERFEY